MRNYAINLNSPVDKHKKITDGRPVSGQLQIRHQQFLQMLDQVPHVPRLHHDHNQCIRQSADLKVVHN